MQVPNYLLCSTLRVHPIITHYGFLNKPNSQYCLLWHVYRVCCSLVSGFKALEEKRFIGNIIITFFSVFMLKNTFALYVT